MKNDITFTTSKVVVKITMESHEWASFKSVLSEWQRQQVEEMKLAQPDDFVNCESGVGGFP